MPICRDGSNMHRCSWPQTRCFMSIEISHRNPFASTTVAPRPPSRRQMLGRMCGGFGIVSLLGMLDPQTLLAGPALSSPHFAPKAKRVIFLFLNGGPSHIDTFDPKPALVEHEGELPSEKLYKKTKTGGFMRSPFKFARHGQSGI